MRLLTIFFCGPTIVTPTFFKSLIWNNREKRRGEKDRVIGLTRGRMGTKIQKTALLT